MDYVYLHGFLSGPDSMKGRFLAEKLDLAGLELHRPDLNGGDFEHMTISSQLRIIENVLDSLSDQVTIFGSSLGGYLAGLTAEKFQKVRRLILMAPAFEFADFYLNKYSKAELDDWKENGFIKLYHFHHKEDRKLAFDIVEDAFQFKNTILSRQLPVQIFHGLRDESVNYRLSIHYLQSHPMADVILFNSDHSLLDKLDIMWDYIHAFLNPQET